MERRRRERINSSLEQLAVLLKEANLVAKDKPVAKLEKADILELTVRHLSDFKKRLTVALQHDGQKELRQLEKLCSNDSSKNDSIIDKESERLTQSDTKLEDMSPPSDKLKTLDISSADVSNDEEGQLIIDESTSLSTSNCEMPFDCSSKPISGDSYLEGFYNCLHEVKRATDSNQDFNSIKERLFSYLESCLKNIPPGIHKFTDGKDKNRGIKRETNWASESDQFSDMPTKKAKLDTKLSIPPSLVDVGTVPGVKLVPMRLADGAMAFLLQGDPLIAAETGERNQIFGDLLLNINKGSVMTARNVNDLNRPANVPFIKSSLIPLPKNVKSHPIQSSEIKSTCNKFSTATSSPIKFSPENIVYGKTSIKTEGSKKSLPINALSQISINVNGTQGVISSTKVLPKVKTVTLPVGTVATTTSDFKTTCVDSKPSAMVPPMKILTSIGCNLQSSVNSFKSNYVKIQSKQLADFPMPSIAPNFLTNSGSSNRTVTISIPESANVLGSNLIPGDNNQYSFVQELPRAPITFPSIEIKSANYASSPCVGRPPIVQSQPSLSIQQYPTFHPSSIHDTNPGITIYPPSPPPSVSLCQDQWMSESPSHDTQTFPVTQQTYTLLSSPPISSSYSTPSPFVTGSLVINNAPVHSNQLSSLPRSGSNTESSSMSLVSSSVKLLDDNGSAAYLNLSQLLATEEQAEDEFIDVVNDETSRDINETPRDLNETLRYLNETPRDPAQNVQVNSRDDWFLYQQGIQIGTKDGQSGHMWRPW